MAILGKVIHISTLIFGDIAYLGGVIQIVIQSFVDNYGHNFYRFQAIIRKKNDQTKKSMHSLCILINFLFTNYTLARWKLCLERPD